MADPAQKPAVPQRYVANAQASNAIASVEKKASESWMSPMQVILAGLVAAVLVALVYYYNTTTMLQVAPANTTPNARNGIFTASNWLTIGGGTLFFVLVAVMLAAGGASIGMSWKKNGDSAMWTMGSTFLLGLLFYFVFAAARDNRKDQFAFWSFLGTVAAIALPGYGWWQARALANDLKVNSADYDAVDKAAIPVRAKWSMITFGVAGLFALIVAAGLYKIYGALPFAQ